jgi:hypothetical protein
MFQSRDERHVPHAAERADGVEQIANHRTVDADVLRFGVVPQPGAEEHVRRLQAGQRFRQRLLQRFGPQQIGDNRHESRRVRHRFPSQPGDRPPIRQQVIRQIVSDNSRRSDDQGRFLR